MMIFVLLFVSSWCVSDLSAGSAAAPTSHPLTLVKLHKTSLKQSSSLLSSDNIAPHQSLSYTMVLIATIPMGTPPQPMDMVMDTGSQLTWVTCASGHTNTSTARMFRPQNSTSLKNYYCNTISDCAINDTISVATNCIPYYNSHKKICNFSYPYTDHFHADGILIKETLDHHHSILLGCTTLLDSSGAQGLMGMNLGTLSFPSQAGITTFSYCVPRQNSSTSSAAAGKFYLGRNPHSKDFQYLRLFNFSPGIPTVDVLAYTVILKCIRFGHEIVNASDPVPGDELDLGYNGIMIDSATQYSYLLANTYADLRVKVDYLTKGFNMTDADIFKAFDMCYPDSADPREVAAKIGDLVFEFDTGVTITVSKDRVLDTIDNKTCVAIGKSALVSNSMSVTHTLGISYQQCHWVEYDTQLRRVGLRKIGSSCEKGNSCG